MMVEVYTPLEFGTLHWFEKAMSIVSPGLSGLFENIQSWMYEVSENRRMEQEQKLIDETEKEFVRKSSLPEENKSWVNPLARKKSENSENFDEDTIEAVRGGGDGANKERLGVSN